MARRVVVTGMSVVTALGQELGEFWEKLCAGKSGVSLIKRFDSDEFKVKFGGEIKDFDPGEHLNSKEVRRLDRFCQFAMVGAAKAIIQSGIDFNSHPDLYRCGVIVGSGIGGLNEIEEQHTTLFDRGPTRVSPFMIPKLMVNAASGNISVQWHLRGPSTAVATACASASNSIGAVRLTATATALCWRKGPAWSSSKSTSTRRSAARRSSRKFWATACRPMERT
jgi:3-oxoacyl-[acyl-carrier-protein] synthase II